MASVGVAPKLKVLYVPDYTPPNLRITMTAKLHREISNLLPSYEIQLALSEGPFEDDDGVGAHFDKESMHGKAPAKQIAGLRIDFHHSIVKLPRYAEMHKPALIFGEGQGALIALGYSKPALVERALQSRNVQQSECGTLAAAWGGVRAVIIHEPRVSRLGLRQDKLRTAVPELHEKPENPVVAPLPTWVLTERRSAQYDALKVFLSEPKLAHVTELSAVPFGQLVTNSARIMWDHDGECSCGRRTYLMSQCIKCLEEETVEKIKDEADAALALPVPAPEVSSAGGTRRLATPIPSELIRLPNKLSLVTDKVIFIDDATIASFAAKPNSWEYGVVFVCIWDGTRDCTLPSPSKPASSKYLFRIAFRKDPDGTVIPVQQCVDVRREPACVLLASQFPNHARYVYKWTVWVL